MTQVSVVLEQLAQRGMLLKQDPNLPNVVGIVTGESLRGSWWSHPRAREIFSILNELADHPDVLFTKLLKKKDTLVHRALWPQMMAVGSARAPWQLVDLSNEAKVLLETVDENSEPTIASGTAAKALQNRLLAIGHEIHTQSGRHAMALESWRLWSTRVGCDVAQGEVDARAVIEAAAERLGAVRKVLPWQ
jgi:hypothetical protein